ncbi:MAG TPA: DUF4838 domain-containing protein [Opitutales bacterium]|nr:DUF4838 domain-containing protein [Opitutales bacterium]
MRISAVASCVALGVSCGNACAEETVGLRLANAVVAVNFETGGEKESRKWTRDAADDLTNVLAKVTGRTVPLVAETDVPAGAKAVVYLGDTKAARMAGIDGKDMRNGDWRVKVVPGKAFVFGTTGMGASFAMTEFVERFCGYRFLSPDGEDPHVVDPEKTVPVCDVTVKPAVYDRGIFHGVRYMSMVSATEAPVWDTFARRRRCPEFPPSQDAGTRRLSAQAKSCHSFYDYVPPAKYFKEHPEYFSMNSAGKRTAVPNAQSQLCFSNRDMWRVALESLERFVANDRRQKPKGYPCVYDFSQMDNSDFICLCPECKKVIARYNRVEGGHKEGGDAGLQLECVNWLAREIAKKHPDVLIRTFAYVSTGCAPKPGTIAVEPNVIIRWCDVYSLSDHTRPLATEGHFNYKQAQELADWCTLTKNVQLWDYMLYGESSLDTCPDAFAGDAQLFRRAGVDSVFMETEYKRQPFYLVNYYLLSQLYVNPSANVDALIDEACEMYGPAAREMRAAIEYTRHLSFDNPAPTAYDWHVRRLPWLTRENIAKLVDLLKKAYARVADGPKPCRARVAQALAGALLEQIRLIMPDPNEKAALAATKELYLKCSEQYAAEGFVCAADRAKVRQDAYDTFELMSLSFKDMPPELKEVPADELACVDYHRSWNKDKDPLSERGMTTFARFGDYPYKYPTGCGIYDWGTKDHYPFKIVAEGMTEGKYCWQRLGIAHFGNMTGFWFPSSWLNRIELRSYYILADGLTVDPNWYEAWVSVRLEGPAAFPGSEKKNLMAVDRLAFRRVKPPKGK